MQDDAKDRGVIKDRVLGDEWRSWDPSTDPALNDTDEKRGTFFIVLFSMVAITVAASFLALYLVTPRLRQIGTLLETAVISVVVLFTVFLVAWYLALLFAVVSGRRTIFSGGINRRILVYAVEKVSSLGLRVGISKDRISNSFLKVFNRVIEQDVVHKLPLRPLIILPRCLGLKIREGAQDIAEKYGLDSFIVGGGEAAKARIREKNPQAIIGVACERDLISGIREVSSKIPVIGIANKRPEGPCRDTLIDLEELEKAVKYFLGV